MCSVEATAVNILHCTVLKSVHVCVCVCCVLCVCVLCVCGVCVCMVWCVCVWYGVWCVCVCVFVRVCIRAGVYAYAWRVGEWVRTPRSVCVCVSIFVLESP